MGTTLESKVWARDAETGFAAIESAFAEVRRIEELLSSWRADSELSRLNSAHAGSAVELSSELFALLREVQEWAAGSGGAFDPALGPLVDAWDLRGKGRRPSEAELAHALAASGLDGFELDERARTAVRQRPGAWLTAGGFGKGAALRAARVSLEEAGIESALLDFGGQILALGSAERSERWAVGVADPARRDRCIAAIRLRDRSAATSAASERFVEIDAARYGHILDPRTGRPVPAWGSVTAVSDDPLLADMASTTLFVLGPEAGMSWAEDREDLGVLFIDVRGNGLVAKWNRAMQPWLIESDGRDGIGTCVTDQY
jgi:thiamine biosynthesis lipoprotein